MNKLSLAARLGLKVGLVSVGLLILFSIVSYFSLGKALDRMARERLETKMVGMAHNLRNIENIQGVKSYSHLLFGLAMRHKNLYFNIYDPSSSNAAILEIGSGKLKSLLDVFPAHNELELYSWQDENNQPILTATQILTLKDGSRVSVYMTSMEPADAKLLNALLKWGLALSPLAFALLMVIGWWTVRRGLLPLTNFLRIASSISTESLSQRVPTVSLPYELRILAYEINSMLDRLDGGVQQLSQFSDDLAHELRAPLSNLLGKAQVILSKERSGSEYREVLESSAEELERIKIMVADMLFLAQVSQPAEVLKFESISLKDEALLVCELFCFSADDREIKINISGRAGVISGNRLMVQRAISNIVSNAIRHCTTGGVIEIIIKRNNMHTIVSVGNPGRTIAKHHLPFLFERFYRADSSRARTEGGTGLGLAIVRSIMSIHGGVAEVDVSAENMIWFHLKFHNSP